MAENTTAHTEVPGAPHKGAFPPFNRETFPSQLFWLAICFIALYVMTARLVRPRVGGIIKSRSDRIAGDLAEAGRLKGESEAAMALASDSFFGGGGPQRTADPTKARSDRCGPKKS